MIHRYLYIYIYINEAIHSLVNRTRGQSYTREDVHLKYFYFSF